MNLIYIVWAYRWASLIEHNYLVGVYDDPEIAISKANEEVSFRGGKYDCIVYKTKLNDPSRETWKEIEKPLPKEKHELYYKFEINNDVANFINNFLKQNKINFEVFSRGNGSININLKEVK